MPFVDPQISGVKGAQHLGQVGGVGVGAPAGNRHGAGPGAHIAHPTAQLGGHRCQTCELLHIQHILVHLLIRDVNNCMLWNLHRGMGEADAQF